MKLTGNFDEASRREQRRVVAESTEFFRGFTQELYAELVKDAKDGGPGGSPVASGRFAASMRVGVNEIDTSTAPADPEYKYPPGSGPRPLPPRTIRNVPASQVSAKLRRFKLGDRIYLSNSAPYSRRIETGRWSWQTPDGVFGPTVRAVSARFSNVRLKVRNV